MTRHFFVLTASVLLAAASDAYAAPILLQQATATFSQSGFSIGAAIDGSSATGWAIDPNEVNQTAVFETSTDVFTSGGTLTFTLSQLLGNQHTIGRLRLSATTDNRSLFADGLASGGDVTANWTVLNPASYVSTNSATLTELGDNSILASGTSPQTDIYTISLFTALSGITGFRLEVLEDPSLPFNGPGRQPINGNFVLTNLAVDAVNATPTTVPEPTSLILLGGGLAGLIARKRRSERAQQPNR